MHPPPHILSGPCILGRLRRTVHAGRVMPVLLALLAWARPAAAAEVQVRVVNVGDAAGTVRAELCREEEWLKDGCDRKADAPAAPGVTTVSLTGVPEGRWAVVVFHDRNDNGEVDRSLLGIPEEGVGFSRNPSLGLGGPRFDDCAIAVGPGGAVIDVRLRFE